MFFNKHVRNSEIQNVPLAWEKQKKTNNNNDNKD